MRPTVYTSRSRDTYPARLLRSLYSAIIPGAGQLAAGVRRRGLALLFIFVVVTLAAVIIVLTQGFDGIITWVVQPKVLLTLLWIDIIIMLIRMFAVIDAWLTAKAGTLKPVRPSGPGIVLTGVGLILILAFTVVPHAMAGYYTVVSHNLLTTVFAGDDAKSTSTTKADGSSGTSGGSGSTTSDGSTTTTAAPLEWGSDGRMTVLLIGTDQGFGRSGARADSINVASIDLETGRVAMFGLPRNTGGTPLGPKTSEALGMKTYPEMLNSLYTAASAHPEIDEGGRDPGAVALMETAGLIMGIKVDYYAVVNMMGLVDMVDALGGIDINLKSPMNIRYAPLNEGEEKKTYHFKVGANRMDGLEALAYARNRSDSDDYVRMGRQRCVLMAMLYQNSVSELTLRFPRIASALEKSVMTNIPLDALPDLIKMRSKIKTGSMITVGFTPPDWISGYTEDRYNVLDFPKVKAAVKVILNDPDKWIADHAPTEPSTSKASDCWTITD